MKPKTDIAGNERGFVLIATMVILLLLLVLGLSANTTSSIDLQLAGNDKTSQMAFFNADAGIYSSPKVISQALEDHADPTSSDSLNANANAQIYDSPPTSPIFTFYDQIMGFDADNDTNPLTDPEFSFTLDNFTVAVNIQRIGTKPLSGNEGNEFGTGALNGGGGSGRAILYSLDSTGQAPDNALSSISAVYQKVPGAAGGL